MAELLNTDKGEGDWSENGRSVPESKAHREAGDFGMLRM